MNDFGPTNLHETRSGGPLQSPPSEPSVAGSSAAGAVPSPSSASSIDCSASAPVAKQARRPTARRLLANRKSRWTAAAALVCAVSGVSVSLATSPPATAAPLVADASPARSAPAQGGASGTVGTVSTSSFTITTSAGQKVTVDEKSSTTYEKGSTSTSAKAVTKGEGVLALGTVNSTTITATQVVVGYKSPSSAVSTAKVVPFVKGQPTTSKQVGQIPANWSAGQGTIVSGTTANKATEAALAAYPGAVVERVAKLNDGEYNVHFIGVNWPHHVFESSGFKVVGAL